MNYEFSAFATMESGNTMRKDKTQMSMLRNLSEKLVAKFPATRLSYAMVKIGRFDYAF